LKGAASFACIYAGNIQNQGWEVTLNGTPILTSDFTWKTSINFSTNKISYFHRISVTFHQWKSFVISFCFINNVSCGITYKGLNGTPILTSDFTWKTSINFSANKNKIVKLHDELKELSVGTIIGQIDS